MKILKKRAIALLIDSFLFAFPIAALQIIFTDLLSGKGLLLLILFIPFFMRDIVFKNASIGKKLLGICIYDKEWKKPSFKKLLARSFCTATVVYAMLYKAIFADGNFLAPIDWELNKLGTRVIDKKVFEKLDETAKNMNGTYEKNMSELYGAYLRDLYLK